MTIIRYLDLVIVSRVKKLLLELVYSYILEVDL